ncbi:very short patch repair endonuclease [Mesorhizobium sp. M0184]|uniref:very short patch repair endonuclease n=1 Tax=Mesorhizobium sp. M0184 TaxID=2956906 RepID=UPI003337EA39
MVDRITTEQRSRNMSRIKGRDTQPEVRLRSALHRAGLRFRVCRTDLPGRPDVVFVRQRLAVQVRGCFWHQHRSCTGGRIPRSNVEYWKPKLARNVKRDAEKDAALRSLGWRVLIVWACEIDTSAGVACIVERVIREFSGER